VDKWIKDTRALCPPASPLSPAIYQYGQIAANTALGDIPEAGVVDSDTSTVNKMGKGESVDLVAIKRHSFSATVNIVVTNNTEQFLDMRKEWVKGGEAINRPVDIPPGGQEAFLVSRNHRGNHGTVAYNLGSSNLVLLVMWTSGMNCDHYANILAVGVTTAQNTDKFSQMYFESHPWFCRQNFQYNDNPLVLQAENFTITASMSIRPQADVHVTIQEEQWNI